MMTAGYLLLNGAEVVNEHRTLTYLRRGLAGSGFEVCVANPLVVSEGSGYSDAYGDVYEGDPFAVQNLCCYCSVFDFGNYQDPAYDGAPWYDAARPESNEFFGIIPEVRLLAPAGRNVTQRSAGRADVGPLVVGARIVQVRGFMYAASPAAMEYGERWLSQVLAGGGPGCAGDVLTLLPACPPDAAEDGSAYLRDLLNVGIVDGPVFGEASRDVPECLVEEVSFQWAAGEPWLRARTTLDEEDLVALPFFCSTMGPAGPGGSTAANVTITAGPSTLDGVVVSAKANACPGSGPVAATWTVDGLPANATLVVDSARETVEVRSAAGVLLGGLKYVSFLGLFRWMKAGPQAELAISVDAQTATGTAGSTAKVEQVLLEL